MKKLLDQNIITLNKQFFEEFLNSLESLKDNKKIMIGLSGGSSVSTFYYYIKNNYSKIPENIRKKINYCFLDERIVPLYNEDSNYKQLKEQFFDELIKDNFLEDNQILKIDLEKENIAEDYFKRVKSIDIGLFGVGPDGHTCSLFPNDYLLDNETVSYLTIKNSPKPPSRRITISKNMLKNIKDSFVFFIGNGKKEAYLNFLDKSLSYKQAPTKLIIDCENSFVISNIIS